MYDSRSRSQESYDNRTKDTYDNYENRSKDHYDNYENRNQESYINRNRFEEAIERYEKRGQDRTEQRSQDLYDSSYDRRSMTRRESRFDQTDRGSRSTEMDPSYSQDRSSYPSTSSAFLPVPIPTESNSILASKPSSDMITPETVTLIEMSSNADDPSEWNYRKFSGEANYNDNFPEQSISLSRNLSRYDDNYPSTSRSGQSTSRTYEERVRKSKSRNRSEPRHQPEHQHEYGNQYETEHRHPSETRHQSDYRHQSENSHQPEHRYESQSGHRHHSEHGRQSEHRQDSEYRHHSKNRFQSESETFQCESQYENTSTPHGENRGVKRRIVSNYTAETDNIAPKQSVHNRLGPKEGTNKSYDGEAKRGKSESIGESSGANTQR